MVFVGFGGMSHYNLREVAAMSRAAVQGVSRQVGAGSQV